MDQFAGKGMTMERYRQLSDDPEGQLTPEEIAAGWCFCFCEWDGLLIHKDDPEAEMCNCLNPLVDSAV